MFNMWKKYPNNKPVKDGWYICSIRYGEECNQEYVMDLYYYKKQDKWNDNRRINVFDLYEVLGYGEDVYKKKVLYTDNLCVRKDVVAFKKIPKVYKG